MADSLIDLPGSGLTPTVINPPRIRYPFRHNPVTPDVYARVTERDFKLAAANYDTNGRLSTRTAYTNYTGPSNVFSDPIWIKNDTTVVSSSIANPWDGQITTAKILEAATTAVHNIQYTTIDFGGGWAGSFGPIVVWAIVKGGLGRDWVYLKALDPTKGSPTAFFNLTTGNKGTANGCTSSIFQLLGGYYLIAMTFITDDLISALYIYATTADNAISTYLGDVTKGFYLAYYGAQATTIPGPVILGGGFSAPRTVSVPDVDSIANSTLAAANQLDPFAFLVAESDPAQSDALLGQFTLSYARLPAPQLLPATKYFTRPVLDDVYIASTAWGVSFDPQKRFSWIFLPAQRIAVTAIANLPVPTINDSGTVTPAGTVPRTQKAFTADVFAGSDQVSLVGAGGTYIIVCNTLSTTNVAAIAAATGFGTVSVTNDTHRIVISWLTGTFKGCDPISGSVDISASGNSVTLTRRQTTDYTVSVESPAVGSTVNTQAIAHSGVIPTSIRGFTTGAAHGASAGFQVVFWKLNRIIARSIVFTTPSATVFSCNAADVPGADFAPDFVGFSPNASACYVNGAKVCTTRRTQTFYLPGYSVGITTYADIPNQLVYTDPISWLGRIIAVPTGWANIEVSDVAQWMGAILAQEITEINMAQALDAVTP